MLWSEVKWSRSVVSDSATPWTVAYQAPPSLGFSRQEYWSGLPFPSPGDLPNPGIEPGSPSLQADALPSEPPGKLTSPTSLVAQTVKCLPTIQETWVRSLGQEDPLEKEMATHFSILAWKIPWTKEPGRLQSMGSQRVGHDWVTSLTYSLTKQFCLKEHTSTVDFLRLKGSAITSKNCSWYLQYGHPDHELHTRTFTAAPGVLVNY